MKTLIMGLLLNNEGIMIIWAIALFIFIIICISYVISKRAKDNEENFTRNIKIGAARTLGGLITFFYIWVILLTTIFFINKINEKNKENNNTKKCIIWTTINNEKICGKYE